MKTHFISGLPRSGSTLLSAILKQNPRFIAGMSGPVAAIFRSMQEMTSRKNEAAMFLDDAKRARLLRGIFDAYYYDHGGDVVFDTNRIWCSKMPSIARLYPDAKVICCVRSVSWIMDSIERRVRANPLELSGLFGYDGGGTVFSRVNALAAPGGLVGFAMNALREAYYGENAGRLLLVSYGALSQRPAATLDMIYQFIDEERFEHDFDDVQYEAEEFDAGIGTPGLHTVRPKVAPEPRETILPPDVFERFKTDSFWLSPELNPRQVPVILPGRPRMKERGEED